MFLVFMLNKDKKKFCQCFCYILLLRTWMLYNFYAIDVYNRSIQKIKDINLLFYFASLCR